MGMTKAVIGNKSKKVTIRKCPWDPFNDKEVGETLKAGDPIKVNTDIVVYDWHDRAYYEAWDFYANLTLLGYIAADAVILSRGGASNARRRNAARQYPANDSKTG